MDPEELRAHLREAADSLPGSRPGARAAVARRVRRQRLGALLTITAVVLAVVAAGAVAGDALRGERSIEFIDTPAASPSPAARQACLPVPSPTASDGELVAIYQPCGDTDTVARVDRWLPDRSLLTTMRAVFGCPMLAERDGGRRCAFDGPADGLVTAAEIDGVTARATLTDAVDGLSDSLRNPGGLLAAIQATVFASYDTVERIELPIDTSDDPDALCRMITLPSGCAEPTRAAWADGPDGWRMASVRPPDALGTFGGQHPTGPLRLGDIVVRSGGHGSNLVRAVSAHDGAPRWRHRVDGEDAFVADQMMRDGVLVASTFGPVVALDVASGDRRWVHEVDADQAPGAPAVAGSSVYVPASFGIEGDTRAPTVTALDAASGQVRWRTPLLADTELQWAPPTVSGGLVIVADTPGTARGRSHLHALDAEDGARVWTFELGSRRQGFHSEQPLVHTDLVFAVDDGVLYALDLRTGAERWRTRNGAVTRVFGVAPDGIVVEADARVEVLDVMTGTVAP